MGNRVDIPSELLDGDVRTGRDQQQFGQYEGTPRALMGERRGGGRGAGGLDAQQ